MKKIFLIFAMMISSLALFADEPFLIETYNVKSSNKEFYLHCDADKNTTTCFEITKKGDREKWTVQDYRSNAYVSDSGAYCILDHTQGLVPEDFNEDTVLFKIYKKGNLFDTVTLGKVYKNLTYVTMQATVSHYAWGNINHLYDDGILLTTNEGGQRFWYDFCKKKIVSAEKKIAEIAARERKEAFKSLDKVFADFKKQIKDKDDKEKLSAAVAKIQSLYKNKKLVDSPIEYCDFYEDGDVVFSLFYSRRGRFKGAFNHSVKSFFNFYDGKSYIHFYLCDDNCDLFIDIACGGKRENLEGSYYTEYSRYLEGQTPNRYYKFNAKTKEVRTGDFYWD
ncbi:MAG: hypothetical protein K6B17_02675 [Treponema sp.]|nr:hypothetical protein [Treponema sp.]